jgi:hypothetical protein
LSDRGAAAVAAAVLDTIELIALQDAVAQKEATQGS